MRTRNIFIIVTLLCAQGVVVFSQKINEEKRSFTVSKSKIDKETVKIDSIIGLTDSLRMNWQICDSINDVNESLIAMLEERIHLDSINMECQRDSMQHSIDSLQVVIQNQAYELQKIKSNIGFVDTCMVKLANRWLYEPFDKADVNEAIRYFERIYSSQLKNDLSVVQKLLRDYETSYYEFQYIIKQAQNDIDRESPFACEDYKNKYKQKIKSMIYYIRYYNEPWNIKYLNEQIEKALERLNNHTSDKPADFTSLIGN